MSQSRTDFQSERRESNAGAADVGAFAPVMPGAPGPEPGDDPSNPIFPGFDVGNDFQTATQVELAPGQPLWVAENVGGAGDPYDFYRLDLAEPSTVGVQLQGNADVDLQVYDAQGNLVGVSENRGTEIDGAVGDLPPGTYYVAVVPYDGVPTDYVVGFATAPVQSAPGAPTTGTAGTPGPVAVPVGTNAEPASLALRDQTGLPAATSAQEMMGSTTRMRQPALFGVA
jgi:hypothetical protein